MSTITDLTIHPVHAGLQKGNDKTGNPGGNDYMTTMNVILVTPIDKMIDN